MQFTDSAFSVVAMPQRPLFLVQATIELAQSGPSWRTLHALAKARHRCGHLNEAALRVKQAIALKPASSESHLLLGQILLDQGRCAEAEAPFRRALRAAPDLAEAHAGLGQALHEAGDALPACRERDLALVKAERFLQRAPDSCRNDARVLSVLGVAVAKQGRTQEAELLFRRACNSKPTGHPKAHQNLGVALNAQDRPREAIEALDDAILWRSRKGDGIGATEAQRRGYPKALSNKGEALLALNQFLDAANTFRAAAALDPSDPDLTNNLGVALFNLDENQSALAAFADAERVARARLREARRARHKQRASEAEATLADALLNAGIIHLRAARLAAARTVLQDAAAIRSDHGATYLALGTTLLELGDTRSAVDILREAVQLEPSDHHAHFFHAEALLASGDPRGAEREYRCMLALEPGFSEGRAFFSRALLSWDQPLRALEEATEAITREPLVWQPHLAYAEASAYLGQVQDDPDLYRDAIGAYDRALERLAPHAKGVVISALRPPIVLRLEGATALEDRARAEIHLGRGRTYLRLGALLHGRRDLRRATLLAPSRPEGRLAADELRAANRRLFVSDTLPPWFPYMILVLGWLGLGYGIANVGSHPQALTIAELTLALAAIVCSFIVPSITRLKFGIVEVERTATPAPAQLVSRPTTSNNFGP